MNPVCVTVKTTLNPSGPSHTGDGADTRKLQPPPLVIMRDQIEPAQVKVSVHSPWQPTPLTVHTPAPRRFSVWLNPQVFAPEKVAFSASGTGFGQQATEIPSQ